MPVVPARVAADPARDARATSPGAWQGIRYWRLHGSPEQYLSALADSLADSARTAETWCIFDNTKLGAATTDALGDDVSCAVSVRLNCTAAPRRRALSF